MSKNINILVTVAVTAVLLSPWLSNANPPCSAGHCTVVSPTSVAQCIGNAELLGLTEAEYKKRGGMATTSESGRICNCPCSCVVAETMIGTPNGYQSIPSIQKGEFVLTPLSDSFAGKVSSQHLSLMKSIPVLKTEFSNGQSIVSSSNHTFVTPDQRVISADQLKKGTQILSAENTIVEVVIKPKAGTISEALYNLSVNGNSKVPTDHIIDTNGIMSGDWLLQSNNDIVEEQLFLRTSVLDLFDGQKN